LPPWEKISSQSNSSARMRTRKPRYPTLNSDQHHLRGGAAPSGMLRTTRHMATPHPITEGEHDSSH
jgi:hypothetical protein